jgi:hypothetical protein
MSGAGDPFHSQIMTLFRRRLSLCASTRFPTAPNRCRRGPPTHCEFLAQAPPGDFAYTHHFAKAYIIGT